ncbi:phytoene/squalene synthase family protein [Streptomyces noursei]|uniref:phytoene/squalene synthase family protein n=1 Tax=Streptomyces noursei TaxID=1971 RepID=UPI0030F24871
MVTETAEGAAMYLDRRALDRAGIRDSELREAYEVCRKLLFGSEDGALLITSTLLLPPHKRPHLWALGAFHWYTDTLLDSGDPAMRAERYRAWCSRVDTDLEVGQSGHPVCAAMLHTARTWGITMADIRAGIEGYRMDLAITEYPTYADLERYIDAVDGPCVRMGLCVLEPLTGEAYGRTLALATAMQLIDILYDMAEDARLGRTYVPLEDLHAFGLTLTDLCRGGLTPALRALVRHEVARVRALWAYANGVVNVVEPGCRMWLERIVAYYTAVLDDLERRDYDVTTGKPRLGDARMLVGVRRPRRSSRQNLVGQSHVH